MKVLVSGFRDLAHSKFGGYDFVGYNPNCFFLQANEYERGKFSIKGKWRRLFLIYFDFLTRVTSRNYDLLHIIYGDSQLTFPFFKNRKRVNVITMHRDMELRSPLLKRYTYYMLRKFDAVIVLSKNQQNLYEKKGINSYFIPHGFNTPIFNIVNLGNDFKCSDINIFFSGTNYRDYVTLYKVLDFTEETTNIKFHVVGQKKEKEKLRKYKNVVVYDFLNDDMYYTLLSNCDYNFLPLTFATANNALLEAQSLGIQSILPNIDGITDYAASNPLNFFYKDENELLDFFSALKKNDKSKELVNFSKKYLWDNIYKQLNELYYELYYEKK